MAGESPRRGSSRSISFGFAMSDIPTYLVREGEDLALALAAPVTEAATMA